jgi:transcription elongation factor GreA
MMDADFRRYLAAVKNEEPPASTGDPRWGETEALARRLVDENKVEGALKALEQEPARKKRWDLLLLAALLREALDDHTLALEAYEIIADKLMAAGDRDGVRAILPKFLEPEPESVAVRFLHFLAQDGDVSDDERARLLRDAIAIRPADPELHADLSAVLERLKDLPGSREHRLRSVELQLELGHPERIADELLRLIEEDIEHAPIRVGRALTRFASLVPWTESETLLDLALPELTKRVPGELTWEDLAPLASRVPAKQAPRALFSRYLEIVVAREVDPNAILEGSGALNAAAPIDAVAARLPKILALPPGAHISHTTWGLGRVLASDGENLTLDFPSRSGHKMSFAMATKSLDRLPSDGLRVLAIENAAKLRALAQAGDPEVLVRALRDVGGTATAAQLKPRLDTALPGFEWAQFWKQAKERLKEDGRLDLSAAYRQVYRLGTGKAAEASTFALPQLKPKAPSEGLGLVRRFLKDHPEEESRLQETATTFVRRWALDTTLDPATRAQALCYAASWGALDISATEGILESLIGAGLSPDDLTLGVNQDQLLDLATGSPREEDFLWRAAESRLPRLRDRARARLLELLGDRYSKAVEGRIARPLEAPGLAARLIEHYASKPNDAGAPPLVTLALATIRLLEREIPEGLPERLMTLLGEDGAIRKRVTSEHLDEDTRHKIENTILHWAGSERRLAPIFEFLRGVGMGSIADEYESGRRARAQSLLEGRSTDDVETRFTIMSRVTYDRLEAELRRLALELKTTIPAAIERARQLGDLRENAEYEAAKLKQANAASRVQDLITSLERTRILDTIEIDDSRVGVGTEVILAPLGPGYPPITYWILGEGDSGLAPGVLSYRAPLARPLLGKQVGADVELEMPDGPRGYRVESIVKRLPGADLGSATAPQGTPAAG